MSPVVRPNCLYRWFSDSLSLQCSMLFLVSTREHLRGEGPRGICSLPKSEVNIKPIEVSEEENDGNVIRESYCMFFCAN